jgi:leader peptidase (prepilin peptidase) / N-methyltransferase
VPFGFWAVVVFVYGTIIGSFLNVCIYRMPKDESISDPPSHCPKCNTRLRILDLVPMFSFLLLRRKCRYCGEPISWRYFVVELTTGLLMVAIYWKYQNVLTDFFAFALFSAALIAVFFIDLENWIIPDQLCIFGIVLGIGKDVFNIFDGQKNQALMHIPVVFTGIKIPMLNSILGMVVCGGLMLLIGVVGSKLFAGGGEEEADDDASQDLMVRRKPLATILVVSAPLLAISLVVAAISEKGLSSALYAVVLTAIVASWFLISDLSGSNDDNNPKLIADAEEIGAEGEAMGGGDIKLAAAIGAVLGLKLALMSLFFAVFIGSIIGIGLALVGKRQLKRAALPFGTMMSIGVYFTLFYGEAILKAYLGYLHRI